MEYRVTPERAGSAAPPGGDPRIWGPTRDDMEIQVTPQGLHRSACASGAQNHTRLLQQPLGAGVPLRAHRSPWSPESGSEGEPCRGAGASRGRGLAAEGPGGRAGGCGLALGGRVLGDQGLQWRGARGGEEGGLLGDEAAGGLGRP